MTVPTRVQGVSASIGVAVGPAKVVRGRRTLSYRPIEANTIEAEVARFTQAVSASLKEIERAKEELTEQHGSTYAPILDVFLLMHEDALLIGATTEMIRREGINAQWALSRVVEKLKEPLLRDTSSYFRERAQDIDHVREHLLRHLTDDGASAPAPVGPVVLVARDLTPADAVHLLAPPTLGLVTETGSASSHTSILARTYGVPAVAGTGTLPFAPADGEMVIVDGFSGEATFGPSADQQRAAEVRQTRFLSFLQSERTDNAATRDGVAVSVGANIELLSEVEAAIENGAEGVGLYRTEFMCLDRTEPPSEDEQAEMYRRVASAVAPNAVIFRTFDWRGDKRLRTDQLDSNEQQWLENQIRAVLRAHSDTAVALMFPMIASIQEFDRARDLVDACAKEIGVADPSVGMMVEVPSAALMAEQFAKRADFFAIGTNDLVQYTLGLDRDDYRAAQSASPLHPSVLGLIATAQRAADAAGIECSMCGNMATDPIGLTLAIGLGYRRVSVPVRAIPLARAVIRAVDLGTATRTALEAISCRTVDEVRELALSRFGRELETLWRVRPED